MVFKPVCNDDIGTFKNLQLGSMVQQQNVWRNAFKVVMIKMNTGSKNHLQVRQGRHRIDHDPEKALRSTQF